MELLPTSLKITRTLDSICADGKVRKIDGEFYTYHAMCEGYAYYYTQNMVFRWNPTTDSNELVHYENSNRYITRLVVGEGHIMCSHERVGTPPQKFPSRLVSVKIINGKPGLPHTFTPKSLTLGAYVDNITDYIWGMVSNLPFSSYLTGREKAVLKIGENFENVFTYAGSFERAIIPMRYLSTHAILRLDDVVMLIEASTERHEYFDLRTVVRLFNGTIIKLNYAEQDAGKPVRMIDTYEVINHTRFSDEPCAPLDNPLRGMSSYYVPCKLLPYQTKLYAKYQGERIMQVSE